ncbi:unnamed protein product [Dovyalis caffra]|uniref:Uncharacterized protein n=1 Tax=Dovyalis caffra TaxID=77055 RepID=A0AAV1S440_9ROSI|nr:unnamed protein product [Dovyalis caffra]
MASKEPSEVLDPAFDNPLLIRHPQAHTVPRFGRHLHHDFHDKFNAEVIEDNRVMSESQDAKEEESDDQVGADEDGGGDET